MYLQSLLLRFDLFMIWNICKEAITDNDPETLWNWTDVLLIYAEKKRGCSTVERFYLQLPQK